MYSNATNTTSFRSNFLTTALSSSGVKSSKLAMLVSDSNLRRRRPIMSPPAAGVPKSPSRSSRPYSSA